MLSQLLSLNTARKPTLLQVIIQILAHPHREIRTTSPLVELEELSEPDTERFTELVTNPGTIAPSKPHTPVHFEFEDRDYQFTHLHDVRRQIDFDTYPNRFLRHFLVRYRRALDEHAADPQAADLIRRIDALLAATVMAEVSALHQLSTDHNVLRKDPGYRQILSAHVALGRLLAG